MAGDKVVSTVKKPQLRGLLRGQIKINLAGSLLLCTVAAIVQKVFVNDARKQKYAEFYKSYDINKEFEKMRQKGLFDSC